MRRRDIELRELAAEYRATTADADPKEKRRLRQQQRKAEAVIVKAYQAEDFGAWLHRKTARDEATLERLEALDKQRGAAVEPERELVQKKVPTRAIDPAKDARIAAAYWAKIRIERAIGIEPEVPENKRGRRM